MVPLSMNSKSQVQFRDHPLKQIMFFKVPREDAKYQAAFVTRKHLSLPVSLSTLMNLFEAAIQEKKHAFKVFNSTNCDILNINLRLYQAFNNKTKLEKINYYAQCVEYLDSATKKGGYLDAKKPYLNPIVEANAYLKSKIIGKWDKYTVRISLPNKRMVLAGNKTQIVIALDQYYVRTAKDTSKQSLVLETIMDHTHPSELRIAFDEHFHTELKKILEDLSWEAQKDKFNKILCDSSGEVSFAELKTKFAPSGFLSEKVLDRFQDFKNRFMSKIDEARPNKRFILNQGSKRLYISKDIYYYQEFFFLSKDEFVKAWKLPVDLWNSNVKEYSVIETHEDTNIEVIYEKMRLKDKLYDNIFLREDISTESEGRIIYQGLKNYYQANQNTEPIDFDYSFARVIPISESECKLCLEFDIQFRHKSQFELIGIMVSEFSKVYQCYLNHQKQPALLPSEVMVSSTSMNIKSMTELKPIINSHFDESVMETYEYQSKISAPSKIMSEVSNDPPNTESIIKEDFSIENYIHHNFKLRPEAEIDRQKSVETEHYFSQDWEKAQAGGIVCVNEKMVNEQKKIFKHILASFGKNLFKMKGVLNISLPVGIFKKQSHINTIARNLSYAPILLEPHPNQSVLERMKQAIIFVITTGTVGISMQKPFNPVIGETFQGWIDGCPIYLQQVSHHPPRSAYMMYGRGYKVYGQIEAKVEFGMNSIKGYNQRENIIEFDDGAKISFSIPKMVIKGMLFGDRQFNFDDKNYVYDMMNNVFAEVTFGPQRGGGFFTKAQDPTDFVFGKVMRVSPDFYLNWREKRKIFPKKGDVLEQLSQFEGVWNEKLRFDGRVEFDFKNQLPCRLEHEEYPLLSDSIHRKDIHKLIDGKVEESQAEKERLEESQRRDRKLRETHKQK